MLIKIEDKPEFFNSVIDNLQKGKVIALPTDTIYGFAVDATQTEAVKKLRELKGRVDKPFTFFIAKGNIEDYAKITKRRIIEYFVPGPLTVILEKKERVNLPYLEEKIGIRIPQTEYIIKLLSLYQKPLAVTSANLTGQEVLTSGSEIAEKFTQVDLVINGGNLVSKPSTVLDLTTTPLTITRKGRVAILEIEKVYGRKVHLDNSLKFNVLFVCSANTCRSPMAEGIFKTFVSPEHCAVKSAGTLPMQGMPAAQFSMDVVKEYGGSIKEHQTKMIDQDLIDWADLILVMEFKHYEAVLATSREAAIKTFLLKEYRRKSKHNEVSDPVGKSIDAYRASAQEMLPPLKIVAQDIEKRFVERNNKNGKPNS